MSVHNHGNWRLPEYLVALSEGNSFPAVLEEWELSHIEHLEQGEESETCLCTHYPIREVCHIVNIENDNLAIVGNCCVKRFEGDTAFAGTHKIFDALKRLRVNIENTANKELIEYAHDTNIITNEDRKRYLKIWRKKKLTDRQFNFIRRVNQQILDKTSSKTVQNQRAQEAAARAAAQEAVEAQRAERKREREIAAPAPVQRNFPRPAPFQPSAPAIQLRSAETPPAFALAPVVRSPQQIGRTLFDLFNELKANSNQTADRRVIVAAKEQGLLNPEQYAFYLKLLDGAVTRPTPAQEGFRNKLNYKIVQQLKIGQSPAPQPPAAVSARAPIIFAESVEDLTETPTKLAHPDLIRAAREQGILDDRSNDFYTDITRRGNVVLSEKQQSWVNRLNRDIIHRLRGNQVGEANNNRQVRRRLDVGE
jgi:hypothetical protein